MHAIHSHPHGAPPPLRLLVVDDHIDTANAMRRLFEAHGFSARAVGSYREALKLASEWLPDVLVSDIGLGGKDGFELMHTMRQAYPTLRGIAVTGLDPTECAARGRDAGFAELLTKPVRFDRLIAAVHRLFNPNEN